MADRGELIVVLAIAALIILPFIFTGTTELHFLYDEGGSVMISDNIAKSLVPYRDFAFVYTPLMYYVMSACMSLHDSIITQRLLIFVFTMVGVWGMHMLSGMVIKGRGRVIPPLMYALFMIPIFNIPIPSMLANVFIIFALVLFLRGKAFWSGVMIALCFLTKQNIGMYLIVAFGAYLLIRWNWRAILKVSAGALAVMLPYLLYLTLTGSLEGFIRYLVIFPFQFKDLILPLSLTGPFLHFQPDMQHILQVGLRVLYLAPILIYLASIWEGWKKKGLLLVALVCAANYLQFFPNKDLAHFAWGLAPSFILMGYWLGRKRSVMGLLLAGYVVMALYGIQFFHTSPLINTQQIGLPKTELLWVQPTTAAFVNDVMHEVGNNTIFVFGPERLFHYLGNTEVPHPLDLGYFEGSYVTPALQHSIIVTLEDHPPTYVLVSVTSRPKSYGMVEDFIRANYDYVRSANSSYTAVEIFKLKAHE